MVLIVGLSQCDSPTAQGLGCGIFVLLHLLKHLNMKKVVVISTSLRVGSNSQALAVGWGTN